MKRAQVKVGHHYIARLRGREIVVRVLFEYPSLGGLVTEDNGFYVRNLKSNKILQFKRASKFLRIATLDEITQAKKHYEDFLTISRRCNSENFKADYPNWY